MAFIRVILVALSLVATLAARPAAAQTALSSVERQYLADVEDGIQALIDSYERFSDLMDGYPLQVDEEWVADMAQELAIWSIAYRDAQDVTPPLRLRPIHEDYLAMLALWDGASDDLGDGLSTRDSDKIAEGIDKIGEAVTLMGALQQDITAALEGDLPASTRTTAANPGGAAGDVPTCEELIEWSDQWSPYTTRVGEILGESEAMFADPSLYLDLFVEYGAEFHEMAADVGRISPAPGAEAAQDTLQEALEKYGDAYETLAAAVESNNQALADQGSALFDDASGLVSDFGDQFEELGDSCTGGSSAGSEGSGDEVGNPEIEVGQLVTVRNTVNLRAAPSRDADVVASVEPRTLIEITGPAREGDGLVWWPVLVTSTGDRGYLREDFIIYDQAESGL